MVRTQTPACLGQVASCVLGATGSRPYTSYLPKPRETRFPKLREARPGYCGPLAASSQTWQSMHAPRPPWVHPQLPFLSRAKEFICIFTPLCFNLGPIEGYPGDGHEVRPLDPAVLFQKATQLSR